MPGLDGIAATPRSWRRARHPRSSSSRRSPTASASLEALDAGAVGYLLKDADPDELLRASAPPRSASRRSSPKAARQLIVSRRRDARPPAALTEREREILRLLAEGHPNKVIARTLGISEKTVKNHVSRIFQAIGVTDPRRAALWVQRRSAM